MSYLEKDNSACSNLLLCKRTQFRHEANGMLVVRAQAATCLMLAFNEALVSIVAFALEPRIPHSCHFWLTNPTSVQKHVFIPSCIYPGEPLWDAFRLTVPWLLCLHLLSGKMGV